jgi:hypothetical protein
MYTFCLQLVVLLKSTIAQLRKIKVKPIALALPFNRKGSCKFLEGSLIIKVKEAIG